MNTRTASVARSIGMLVLALVGFSVIIYPIAYEEGWLTTLIGVAVTTLIAAVAVVVARRNEPVALVLGEANDERRKQLTLRARALAGRVAIYSSMAVAILLALLDTLAQQRGIDTTVTLPVKAVNTYGTALVFPVLIYAATRVLASFFLSRKG